MQHLNHSKGNRARICNLDFFLISVINEASLPTSTTTGPWIPLLLNQPPDPPPAKPRKKEEETGQGITDVQRENPVKQTCRSLIVSFRIVVFPPFLPFLHASRSHAMSPLHSHSPFQIQIPFPKVARRSQESRPSKSRALGCRAR